MGRQYLPFARLVYNDWLVDYDHVHNMHQPYALLLTSEVVLLGNIDSFKKEKEGIFGSNMPRIIATTYICKAKRMS